MPSLYGALMPHAGPIYHCVVLLPSHTTMSDKSPSHADGGEPTQSASHTTVHSPSMPSTSRDEVNAPPWDMVSALAELQHDMDKLKEERTLGQAGGDDVTAATTQSTTRGPSQPGRDPDSPQ